jgi:aspartate aminotransferase-like enzyme
MFLVNGSARPPTRATKLTRSPAFAVVFASSRETAAGARVVVKTLVGIVTDAVEALVVVDDSPHAARRRGSRKRVDRKRI